MSADQKLRWIKKSIKLKSKQFITFDQKRKIKILD